MLADMEIEGNYTETYDDYMKMPWHVFLHRATHMKKRTERLKQAASANAKGTKQMMRR